jgi:hypothetical protein
MIEVEFFTYTDEQWNAIKEQVLGDLGVDADRIERLITPTLGEFSIIAMQPLRDRIELVVSKYQLLSDGNRQKPSRADLEALRDDTENLRTGIVAALSERVGAKNDDVAIPFLRPGVDADMLTQTNDYFRKLLRNLKRQIEQAGQRGDNSRKPARDQCWTELLAIWCELDGRPRGLAAAQFLQLTSVPVMGSAVPNLASIIQWLKRRPRQ